MKPALSLLHLSQRLIDRLTLTYAAHQYPANGFSYRGLFFLLLLIGLVVGFPGIQGALIRRQPSPAGGKKRDISDYRLPAGSVLIKNKLYHQCRSGESVALLARRYYRFSRIFHHDRLREKFEEQNSAGFHRKYCRPGTLIRIPDSQLGHPGNRPLALPERTEIRAIYLQGGNTVPGHLSREVTALKAAGGNGIVFDIKDIIGVVNYPSDIPRVEKLRSHRPPIGDLHKTIRFLHERGIYVIARMALFQDSNLARRRPDLAIRDGDGVLLTKGMPLWVDPGIGEVQSYNLELVDEIAGAGVDEIQFDYIRYPAEGDLAEVRYRNVREEGDKTEHLLRFLRAARALTHHRGVKIGIDIFGVTAWGEERDIKNTGQRIEELAPLVDVISPMLYPSHFSYGFYGLKNPADEPHYFYERGTRRILKTTAGNCIVRPWLQAFGWRVSNYNEEYILEQISGSRDGGGIGWMLWNAGNRYELSYRAMSRLR